jgi:hypothetical protein
MIASVKPAGIVCVSVCSVLAVYVQELVDFMYCVWLLYCIRLQGKDEEGAAAAKDSCRMCLNLCQGLRHHN